MTEADIRRVIGDFARAAERCLAAGVDMIHLHGAHGYLLGQFLSPRSNRRTDGYGGSLANRARFPLEVLAAVRKVVGPGYPIGYRISAAEYVEGGLEADESARFAVMLADAGIDLIDVAGGTYESMSKIFQGPEAPKGGFVKEAAAIRRAVGDRVPVSVAQRMNDPVFADRVMEREGFEYVTLARAFHADPDYVRKLTEGRADRILPCIGCNTCANLTVARIPAGCAANPASTYELSRDSYRSSPERVRVMIAGGGVASMHAARFLGLRGYEVLLCEATERLGGQLHYLRRALPEYGTLVDWLARELDELGVRIETGCRVGVPEVSEADPDAVVVATGALGGHLWARTQDPTVPVFDIFSALERPPDEWESDVAVIGGDFAACRVAQHLRRSGVGIHIIEAGAALATDGAFTGLLAEMELEADGGVTIHREATAESITGDGVVIQSRGKEGRLDVGSVVIGGRRPSSELSDELRRSGLAAGIYTIGDALRPRDLYAAGQEAADSRTHRPGRTCRSPPLHPHESHHRRLSLRPESGPAERAFSPSRSGGGLVVPNRPPGDRSLRTARVLAFLWRRPESVTPPLYVAYRQAPTPADELRPIGTAGPREHEGLWSEQPIPGIQPGMADHAPTRMGGGGGGARCEAPDFATFDILASRGAGHHS